MKDDVIRKFNYEVSIETIINENWDSNAHKFGSDLEAAIADFASEVQKAKNMKHSDSDFIGICLVVLDSSDDPEPQFIATYFFEDGEEQEDSIPSNQEIIGFLEGLAEATVA